MLCFFHLHKHLRLFRIHAGRQVRCGGVEYAEFELLGVLRHRDGMEIYYEEKILELVLPVIGITSRMKTGYIVHNYNSWFGLLKGGANARYPRADERHCDCVETLPI